MPVTLSLILSLLAAGGLFFTAYFAITALVGGKRAKASPRMGVSPGDVRGSLNVWVQWDPSQFNVQVYRLLFKFASPYSEQKEGVFTVTYDKPLTASFVQVVQIPDRFRSLIENAKEKFLMTVEFKTVEELTQAKTLTSHRLKEIYRGQGTQPEIPQKLPLVVEDVPSVLSLDYSELVVRRKKLRDLEAAAQAKAKAKAAAPAPKPVTTPAPAPTPKPAEAAKPVEAPAMPADMPVKSVREMVAANNAAKAPVEKP